MKFENLKNWYWFFGIIVAIFIFIVTNTWKLAKYHETLEKSYEELLSITNINKQMSLKGIIWNDTIPLGERLSACDTYIESGYNSLTKKHCEQALKNYSDKNI